jgi:enamine deaminase RidA (YjgF/YER057c/UK114 family)
MFKVRNPATIAPPVGAYSHSVEIPAGARILSIAGQAGIRPDGTLPESFEEQHEEIWKNTLAILEDAGMGPENLVHLNVYSTDASGIRFLAPHRKKYLPEGYLTTSTWVVVSALANPNWVVEMEAIAAKVD